MKEVLASVCRPNASRALSRYSGTSAIDRRIEFSGLTMGAAGSNFSSERAILVISLGLLGREDEGVMKLRELTLREIRAIQMSCGNAHFASQYRYDISDPEAISVNVPSGFTTTSHKIPCLPSSSDLTLVVG